jgi:hypothetical protein
MADEYILKSFGGGAQTTTLLTGFIIDNPSLTVVNGTSFPDGASSPFVIVVDRGLATEEKFLIDTKTGATPATFLIQQAGYDGTSKSNHNAGATIEHCLDAYTIEQANRYVNLQDTKGSLVTHTGTVSAKLAASATNNLTLLTDSTVAAGIKWGQLPTAGIADNAITAAKIADNAVGSDEIAANAVGSSEIATGAVGTDELADDAVTAAKIAANAVGSSEIATGAVGTDELAALAVTNAKIANSTIAAGKLDTAYVQQGTGTGQLPNTVKIGWNGYAIFLEVDATNFGPTWPMNITGNAATVTGSTSANTVNAIVQRASDGSFAASSISCGGLDAAGSSAGFFGHTTSAGNGVVRTGTNNNACTPITTNGPNGTYHISFYYLGNNIGSVYGGTSTVNYNTTSDYRLKENVIPLANALSIVEQIKPKSFNFIVEPDKTYGGFIAHELAEVIPYAVTGEKDAIDEEGKIKPQQVDYSKLVAVLVGAVQELSARITELENK